MFGLRLNHAVDSSALEQVEIGIRQHFALGGDDIVLVSERRGWLPGFPDLETQILFWQRQTSEQQSARYKLRLFKPAAEITFQDFPVPWLLPAFIDDGDPDCC